MTIDKENRRIKGTVLALAREHKLHCPALEGIRKRDQPDFCDIALYDLQILLRKAGIDLTSDEKKELS